MAPINYERISYAGKNAALYTATMPFVGAFSVDAVVFDGTNDYMLRGADLTGVADADSGTISLWFKSNADGASVYLYANTGEFISLVRFSTNKIRITLNSVTPTVLLQLENTTAITNDGNWHHWMASWDLSAGTTHVYRDGTSDKTIVDGPTAGAPDWSRANHAIGARTTGANKISADIAEFYLNIGTEIDLSVEANRRLFIDASGKPVDLGPTGALPTGTAPIIYLRGPYASFPPNKGSGGNFTVTGALTDAATSPSD